MTNTAFMSPRRLGDRMRRLPLIIVGRCNRQYAPHEPAFFKKNVGVLTEGSNTGEQSSGPMCGGIWQLNRDLVKTIVQAASEAEEGGDTLPVGSGGLSGLAAHVVPLRFQYLASVWRNETAHLSDLTEMCNHPAYQSIIAMGRPVLPFLLRELEVNPNYWFSALRQITGENPVLPTMRGKLKEMALAWTEWGKRNDISW